MEERSSMSTCIICCTSCPPSTPETKPLLLQEHPHFQQFCAQIEQAGVAVHSNSVKASATLYSTANLIKTLNSVQLNLFSVCSECLECLTSAANTRAEVQLLEAQVISLQVQLLEAMRNLQGQIGTYYRKIKKVGEIVTGSDPSSLEARVKEGQGGLRRRRTRNSGKEGTNGIVAFREAIVNVASDLEFYLGDLSTKVQTSELPVRDLFDESTGTEEDMVFMDVDCKIEVVPDFTDDTHFVEDVDFQDSLEVEVEVEDAPQEPNASCNPDPDPLAFLGSDSSDAEQSRDSEYSPPPSPELRRQKRQERKKKFVSKLESLNSPEYSDFRQRLIKRICRKTKYREENQDRERCNLSAFSILNELSSKYLLEYDKDQGSLKIDTINVTILDDLESLECTLCGYLAKPQGLTKKREVYMDRAMWNHVLGRHLGAFECSLCFKKMLARPHFVQHMKDHELDIQCDICGKPLVTSGSLNAHKWTHMNAEERRALEEQGVKNPLIKPKRLYQCQECGKQLRSLDALDKHQTQHVPPEEREKVVCPQCGKFLRSTSLHTHLKYACSEIPNKSQQYRVPCDFPGCKVTFKTPAQKKHHWFRMHDPAAATRPFECDQCHKSFKTGDCLRLHAKIHNQTNRFECSKGCGSWFRQKRYRKRHENNCKYDGIGKVKSEQKK